MSVTERARPVTAYRVLEARATLACVGLLLCLAALAWWSTAATSADMGGDMGGDAPMLLGLGAVGTAMPFDMTAGLFLSMWLTMMVAMMLPTIAPIVLLHRMVMHRSGVGIAPTVTFVTGYIVVWSAFGAVPLAVLVGFRGIADGTSWVAPVSGVVLVAAGTYQFTPWKATCLRACQSPLRFLTTHNFGASRQGAFRTGLAHGAFCLGCCWALMAVLFVVGLMNLGWMAAISIVFLAEKHTRGRLVAQVTGTAVVALGLVVLAVPDVLPRLTGVTPMTGM
jgi:predicted metal-binding membrane protein